MLSPDQLGTIGALTSSVVSSVSIVLCNKQLMSGLKFNFGESPVPSSIKPIEATFLVRACLECFQSSQVSENSSQSRCATPLTLNLVWSGVPHTASFRFGHICLDWQFVHIVTLLSIWGIDSYQSNVLTNSLDWALEYHSAFSGNLMLCGWRLCFLSAPIRDPPLISASDSVLHF